MSWGERHRLGDRIDRVFSLASGLPSDELKADLAKYICVLASGYIEAATRDVFGRFSKDRSSPSVHSFVAKELGRKTNLNHDKLITLAASFDSSVRAPLEDSIDDEAKSAIGSIIAHRHQIAHGRDTSISLASIKSYYERAKVLFSLLESYFPAKPAE